MHHTEYLSSLLRCLTWTGKTCKIFLTLFQRFDVAAGEGDADAVDGDLGLNRCLASVLKSLHEGEKRQHGCLLVWLKLTTSDLQLKRYFR